MRTTGPIRRRAIFDCCKWDPQVGDYHRLVTAGRYDVQFSATGYASKIVRDVEVGPGSPATRLDVELENGFPVTVQVSERSSAAPVAGAHVRLIATSDTADEPALYGFDAVYLAPPLAAQPAEFEARLVAILAREQPDLVIPCRDDDVEWLARFRVRHGDGVTAYLCGAPEPVGPLVVR